MVSTGGLVVRSTGLVVLSLVSTGQVRVSLTDLVELDS